MSASSNRRYRTDENYRKTVIARDQARVEFYREHSRYWRDLQRARSQVYNLSDSVRSYQRKITKLKDRLRHFRRRQETLELLFGQERAGWKREGKTWQQSAAAKP